MAAFITTLQLLVLGALVSPVYLQTPCEVITNTTQLGSFSVSVSPTAYNTNTTYNGVGGGSYDASKPSSQESPETSTVHVTVSGIATNSSVILQALNSQNASVGQWAVSSVNCSNGTVVNIQNVINNATVQWTSPSNGTGPVNIRVFQVLTNGSALLQKATLNAESTTPSTSTQTSITTSTTSTTSRGSVSTTQASSFLVAMVHLLSVLVTGKLFS